MNATAHTPSTAVFVAYRVAGENWKTRAFKNFAAFEKFQDKVWDKYGHCIEFRYAAER